jgi:hypothetical protein
LKTYKINPEIYICLKENFGMFFFHRTEENGDILIQPISEYIFKDMVRMCGKDKFEFEFEFVS